MAIKIAFTSPKGGCGKSIACQNIAVGLVRLGKKVLVMDFDSNPCLTRHMYKGEYSKSIADIFDGAFIEQNIDIKNLIVKNHNGIDIIPASTRLAITEIKLPGVIGCDFIIKEAIEKIDNDYDYILLDCPGNTSKLTVNALVAADSMIIPLEPTDDSVEVINTMTSIAKGVKRENPKLEIAGFLLNKINRQIISHRAIVSKVRMICDKVFITEIRSSCRPGEAADKCNSVFDIKNGESIASDYDNVVREICALEINDERKSGVMEWAKQ